MDKKDKRKKILKVSGLIVLFLLVFGLSYALFTVTLNGTKKVKIKTGKIELQLLDKNNNPIYSTSNNVETSYEINLDNQVPVSDEEGLESTAFEFKLKNTGNLKANYTIYLDDVALETGESRIDDEYIRYSLTKNGSEENPRGLSSRELDKGTIEADNTTNTYTLKIWIAEDATNEAMDKVFNATLRVEGTQYVAPASPYAKGTFASAIYKKGVVGEYDAITAKVPNGFNSENEESGLYKYTDSDNTTTYVYRGMPEDNYVTFANQNWRILRIQDDGTVKLIREEAVNYENTDYDYDSKESSGVTYRRVQYVKTYANDLNNSTESTKYSTSNIKSYVEAWYDDTMTSYDDKVKENIYCSDRYDLKDDNSIHSYYNILYGVFNRVELTGNTYQWSPNISCTSGEEIVSKVALTTADENILAGGFYSNGASDSVDFYLRKTYTYHTMSPGGVEVTYKYTPISYVVYYTGLVNAMPVTNYDAVRPVITLKANATIASGDGTSEHPYIIS